MGDAGKETNYTFTGQESDPESELYYYNARYYNPRSGRFISRDVVLGKDGDILSRNLYIYVKNNPLKYTDPTGNEEKKIKDFLNSDGLQNTLGFASKFNDAAWNTLEGTSNLFWHPVDSVKGIGSAFGDLFGGGFNSAVSLTQRIGEAGFSGLGNDIKTDVSRLAAGYNNMSGRQKSELFGVITERLLEMGVMVKGVGRIGSAQETATIYRVEGTSNTKILIDSSGNIKVNVTSDCLYINCGSLDTSINYLSKKIKGGLPNPQLKAFDVNKSFVDKLEAEAVRQDMHRSSPTSPFRVDVTTGADQYGLTRTQIQQLKENIIQGSGRIINPFE